MEKESKRDFNEKFQNFINSAKKAGKKAAAKTAELADTASLNIKLQGLNVKLSEKFEELGRLSYNKLSGIGEVSEEPTDCTAESERVDDTVDKIADLVDQINKLYEQISCLKAEIKAKKQSKK